MSAAAWTSIASMFAALVGAVALVVSTRNKRTPTTDDDTPAPLVEPEPSFKDVAELLTADYRQREERDRLAAERDRLASAAFRTWALRAIEILQRFIRSLGHEPPDVGPQP